VEEVIEVTLRITSILKRLGIPYLVGGSFASTVHGHPRATQDVDVVADLRQEHVAPFVAALEGEFYFDEPAIRDAVARRSTFNVIHLGTVFKVDVFVAGDKDSTRRELERRQTYALETDPPEEIDVASPEDISSRSCTGIGSEIRCRTANGVTPRVCSSREERHSTSNTCASLLRIWV